MNKFPERLRDLRREYGENQEDLSKLLGLTRSTIGEYERGRIMPPFDKLKIIANHYQVTVDYLMGNSDIATEDVRKEESPANISRTLNDVLDQLQHANGDLLFNGKVIDFELRRLLIASMEQIMLTGEIIQRLK